MAPPIIKPENVLKRAEELILVGQPQVALNSLHDLILSKRHRSNPLNLENIMMKYVSLAVDMRKGKMAREALTQYRNASQHVNIYSLEIVIKRFIELAEDKVAEARAKASETIVTLVDDLDEIETPEGILMRTVCDDNSTDRLDRDVVMPWLRFLWEVYRISLDTLRNNNKLESLYQSIVQHAFDFCVKFLRKMEFRRLCEVLRNHLLMIIKTASSPVVYGNAILLSSPESLQVQLEIRFSQLNTAVQLEIWQEAFRSVEDIHGLLVIGKKPVKPTLMINYYESLVKIFKMSDNALFHATAWYKLLSFVRSQNKSVSDEQMSVMSACALLSALAIPVNQAGGATSLFGDLNEYDDGHHSKEWKLTLLLGLTKTPTREYLIKEATSKAYWSLIPNNVKELYDLLERQFTLKTLCKKYLKYHDDLSHNEEYKYFLPGIKGVVMERLIEQLSLFVKSVSFSELKNLAGAIFPLDRIWPIESYILRQSRSSALDISIDHNAEMVLFKNNSIIKSVSMDTTGLDLNKIKSLAEESKLIEITGKLKAAIGDLDMQDPVFVEVTTSFDDLRNRVEEEHLNLLKRRDLIEKRKEIMENLAMKKEREDAQERLLKAQREQEYEKIRRDDELKRREQERFKKEKEEIQKAEKLLIAEQVNRQLATVGKKLDLQVEDILKLDRNEIIQRQASQLEKGKKESEKRLQAIAKRMDHLERAYRLEEKPLWELDFEKQKARDIKEYELMAVQKATTAKSKFDFDNMLIRRSKVIANDALTFLNEWKSRKGIEAKELAQLNEKLLAEAKESRRQQINRTRLEMANKMKEDEMAMERSRMEEQLQEQELLKKKKEERERYEQLERASEKQRAKEREIEERLKATSTTHNTSEKEAAPKAKYVPPSLRRQMT